MMSDAYLAERGLECMRYLPATCDHETTSPGFIGVFADSVSSIRFFAAIASLLVPNSGDFLRVDPRPPVRQTTRNPPGVFSMCAMKRSPDLDYEKVAI